MTWVLLPDGDRRARNCRHPKLRALRMPSWTSADGRLSALIDRATVELEDDASPERVAAYRALIEELEEILTRRETGTPIED